ncbi:hypothetical protein BEK98_44725 [Streptomyces diastatochromogenes]|uniref:STAS domain-containing protein n=1 Tax=Streptomyces diastatochromogenes TaxID=42236 RepID=A0A233RSN7_STRDA|nr:hypothetical protein BEK98_44725 [Streptomyces diastatochromogenes]
MLPVSGKRRAARRVTCITSDGADAFFRALFAARRHNSRVTVTCASPQARAALTQLGLARLLDIRGTENRGGS